MSDEQVALVTGTSSGIGLWTAVGLARAGVRVVATMRNPTRDDALRSAAADAGVESDVRVLDVTDRSGTAECVDRVLRDYGRIDVLVNNAGRGSVATLEQLDDAALQEQLDINYLGVAALTRLVLPAMRAAGRGRIVTVTSVGGAVGQPFADAYCGAKFAVEGLMQSLAPVVKRFGIDVSIVEPAAVGSEFVTNAGVDPDATVPADDPTPSCSPPTCGAAPAHSPRRSSPATPPPSWSRPPRPRRRGSGGRLRTARRLRRVVLADLDGSRVLGQTATWLD